MSAFKPPGPTSSSEPRVWRSGLGHQWQRSNDLIGVGQRSTITGHFIRYARLSSPASLSIMTSDPHRQQGKVTSGLFFLSCFGGGAFSVNPGYGSRNAQDINSALCVSSLPVWFWQLRLPTCVFSWSLCPSSSCVPSVSSSSSSSSSSKVPLCQWFSLLRAGFCLRVLYCVQRGAGVAMVQRSKITPSFISCS